MPDNGATAVISATAVIALEPQGKMLGCVLNADGPINSDPIPTAANLLAIDVTLPLAVSPGMPPDLIISRYGVGGLAAWWVGLGETTGVLTNECVSTVSTDDYNEVLPASGVADITLVAGRHTIVLVAASGSKYDQIWIDGGLENVIFSADGWAPMWPLGSVITVGGRVSPEHLSLQDINRVAVHDRPWSADEHLKFFNRKPVPMTYEVPCP